MKKIMLTKELLKDNEACKVWTDFFNKRYPTGVNIADKKEQEKFVDFIKKMNNERFEKFKRLLYVNCEIFKQPYTKLNVIEDCLEKVLIWGEYADKVYKAFIYSIEDGYDYSILLNGFNKALKKF